MQYSQKRGKHDQLKSYFPAQQSRKVTLPATRFVHPHSWSQPTKTPTFPHQKAKKSRHQQHVVSYNPGAERSEALASRAAGPSGARNTSGVTQQHQRRHIQPTRAAFGHNKTARPHWGRAAVAVALGFEPRVAVTPHSISSAAPSAARTRYLTQILYYTLPLSTQIDRPSWEQGHTAAWEQGHTATQPHSHTTTRSTHSARNGNILNMQID